MTAPDAIVKFEEELPKLRFVLRDKRRILQQAWTTKDIDMTTRQAIKQEIVWRDVPMVEEVMTVKE